jgi:cytochrome c peroxidase
MNWDLLNDGMGNPKNVKSMLLAHATPPTTWLGIRPNAEVSVRSGFKHIQFAVRPEEDALAIDAYLKSLEPVPSPYLVDGALSNSARRGEKMFEQAGCIRCHPAPLYTDLKRYELGTTRGRDEGLPVDVPSLIEVWRTAPYMHDGRAATMHDVLKSVGHTEILKQTETLSVNEINDLIEYILSL